MNLTCIHEHGLGCGASWEVGDLVRGCVATAYGMPRGPKVRGAMALKGPAGDQGHEENVHMCGVCTARQPQQGLKIEGQGEGGWGGTHLHSPHVHPHRMNTHIAHVMSMSQCSRSQCSRPQCACQNAAAPCSLHPLPIATPVLSMACRTPPPCCLAAPI